MAQITKFMAITVTGLALTVSACTSPGKKTAIGAGVGAAAGAAVGAVIGHQSGNRGQGALIGAALGGALGGTVGNRLDKQAKELEAIAETKRTETGILTKLKSDILFDTGKADIKPAAADNITKMADILKKYPENVLAIEGYTDSTGSDAVNAALSQKRADAVKNELVNRGVPAATISTSGKGEANPVGDNKTNDGRRQNRRVEINITVDESKVPKEG